MVKSTKKSTTKRSKRTARKTSGRKARTQKRDRKGRFKASVSSRIFSVFRPRGKLSAATKQSKNRASKARPERTVDVRADVRKGNMRPEHVEDDYTRIVNKGFDRREIAVINKSGGVDIVVQNTRRRYAAEYSGKNENGRHDVAVDPRFIRDPETMTHETIHILQEVDPKRPAEDRKLSIHKKGGLTPEERSLKEAMTEAEAIARVREPRIDRTSFYGDIDNRKAGTMKQQDVNTIRGAMKGKSVGEAPGVVSSLFGRLHISRYHVEDGKRTAKQQRDHMQKKK